MLIPNYFEDLALNEVNTLPRRNYFVPYKSKEEALANTNRRQSSYYHDLNGEWDFHYFENVRLIDQPYWLTEHANGLTYDSIIAKRLEPSSNRKLIHLHALSTNKVGRLTAHFQNNGSPTPH